MITVTFRPAHPSIGDPIAIDFPSAPVRLAPSKDYEIVSVHGNRAIVRTFTPKPFAIDGSSGTVVFSHLTIPVRSVLVQNDPMQPAALAPPVAAPYERMPFVLLAIAALVAIAAWIAVVRLAKRVARPAASAPPLAPSERFRRDVAAAFDAPKRWAALADALRIYLDATYRFSADLTTTEVLARSHDATIATVLRQGDLEKFSPYRAEPMDFDAVAAAALALVPAEPVEPAA